VCVCVCGGGGVGGLGGREGTEGGGCWGGVHAGVGS
jgi:hypothetical protein